MNRCTRSLLAPLLLALPVSSCVVPLPGVRESQPQPAPTPADPGMAPAAAAAILEEANRVRASVAGARRMLHNDALQRAAQDYANELARRRVLDHTSPTPGLRTMQQRVEAVGVAWTRVAENLGQLGGPVSTVPQRVIQLWLDSPGHRANLLDPAWTESGVGIAGDDRGYYYVVQLYLVPRTSRD